MIDGCLLEKLGYERLILFRSLLQSLLVERNIYAHGVGLLVEIANLYVQGVLVQILVDLIFRARE